MAYMNNVRIFELQPKHYPSMPIQRSSKISDSQKVFIGLDVHLKQWNVCIIHGGIRRKSFQQPPSAECLKSYLQRNFPGMEYLSAYEAGVCGTSVHYSLLAVGISNIIFNAADISQTHKEKVRKTDAVDASKIARSLAGGELKCVHIPPQWRVADRNLLRLRSAQISDIKRLKARIRHYLHTNGIVIPVQFSKGHWPKLFFTWLSTISSELSNSTGEALAVMVGTLSALMEDHSGVNRRLIEMMKTDRYATDYNLIRTVPGVGAVTAITILLECGDLSDFKSAESFCAFIGLVPDMDRSDSHDGHCGITCRRHRVLRYMLTECAWRAVAKDEYMSRLYCSYKKRMPAVKAIVKIANKLAKIIKFVLRNKTAYVQPQ